MCRTPSPAVGLQRVPPLPGGSAELLIYPLTPSPRLHLFSTYVPNVHMCLGPSGAWRSGADGCRQRLVTPTQVPGTDLNRESPTFGPDFPTLLLRSSPSRGLTQGPRGASGLPAPLLSSPSQQSSQLAPSRLVPKSQGQMEGGGPRRARELVAGRKAGPAGEDACNSRRSGPPAPNGGGQVRGVPGVWAGRLRGEAARKSKRDRGR